MKGDKDHGHNKRSQGMTNLLYRIDCVPSNNVTETKKNILGLGEGLMSVRFESAVFMRKNYWDNRHSITNTKDLTQTNVRHIHKIGV